MFRKFYDPEVAEPKTSAKYELAGNLDINDVYESIKSDKEEKPEIKEDAKPDAKIEEKTLDIKPEVKEEVKIPDWKEFVKNPANKKEIFSLLNIDEDSFNLSNEIKEDDFVKKTITYRKEHGNLTPFIEAATKDWSKVSHENLILDDLKKQYSSLSQEKAEKLAKSDFNQRFSYKEDVSLSPEENAEMAELMSLKLESEAEKIRAARTSEQKQFLDSVKPIDKAAETQKLSQAREESAKKEMEQFSSMIEAHPSFQKLSSEKKIKLGSGDNVFNQEANPSSIKQQALNVNEFINKFWSDSDGKEIFDIDKWGKVMTYAENPAAFEDALINHGRSLGTGKVVESLENAKEKTDKQTAKQEKKTLSKTFATEGQPLTLQELYGG